MAHRLLFLINVVIFVGLLLGCSTEQESEEYIEEGTRSLYVFGDSWADQMDDGVIQRELEDRGYDESVTVIPFGIGGTTMAQWSSDFEGVTSDMLDVIATDPNPDPILFFTLGGNDYLDTGSAESVPGDLRQFLRELEGSRDDLTIVFAQYDILNPAIGSEQCGELFGEVFGTTDPAVMNRYWLDMYAASATVAAEFERVTAVNTYGTLQGQPGDPDLAAWSSVDYLDDCIHLNEEGYGIYLDTVFDEAITPLLENG